MTIITTITKENKITQVTLNNGINKLIQEARINIYIRKFEPMIETRSYHSHIPVNIDK